MPAIDVWAALADPEVPRDVGQRLLTRQRARRQGLTPDPVPEADKPFLAPHIVHQCAHGEITRPYGGRWAHLSDGQPCPPVDWDEAVTP